MKTIIRKGKKTDASEILSLIKELAVFERAPNAVIINRESIEKFGFGRNPLFKCFVAQQGEKNRWSCSFLSEVFDMEGPYFTFGRPNCY